MTQDLPPSSNDDPIHYAKKGESDPPSDAGGDTGRSSLAEDQIPSTPAERATRRNKRPTGGAIGLAVVVVLVIAGAAVALAVLSNDPTSVTTTTAAAAADVPEDSQVSDTDSVLPVNTGGTLAAVLGRGHLRCGVSGRLVGFSESQANGDVEGFDADFCRAVAAAVFSDTEAVEFVPLAAGDRFNAVATGDVDVLFRNTTWTLLRDSQLMVDFGPTTFYDGQKLMGRRAFPFSESSTTADLDGVTVCAIPGSAPERNIAQRAASKGISVSFVPVQNPAEALQKFQLGACDVMTTDGSSLIAGKTTNDLKNEWVIFPRRPLSREPLGPVYASNDSQWADIVNWVVFTTIIAESNNLSTANLSPLPSDAESARLLGLEGTLASDLGLASDALAQVIRQVGNYGEIYDRNLTRFGISRSGTFNELAEHGGLLYAPPVR